MWVPDGTESSYLADGDYTLNPIQAGVSDAQTFMGGPGLGGILPGTRPMDVRNPIESLDTGVGRAESAAVAAGPALPPLPVGSPLGHPDRPMYLAAQQKPGA